MNIPKNLFEQIELYMRKETHDEVQAQMGVPQNSEQYNEFIIRYLKVDGDFDYNEKERNEALKNLNSEYIKKTNSTDMEEFVQKYGNYIFSDSWSHWNDAYASDKQKAEFAMLNEYDKKVWEIGEQLPFERFKDVLLDEFFVDAIDTHFYGEEQGIQLEYVIPVKATTYFGRENPNEIVDCLYTHIGAIELYVETPIVEDNPIGLNNFTKLELMLYEKAEQMGFGENDYLFDIPNPDEIMFENESSSYATKHGYGRTLDPFLSVKEKEDMVKQGLTPKPCAFSLELAPYHASSSEYFKAVHIGWLNSNIYPYTNNSFGFHVKNILNDEAWVCTKDFPKIIPNSYTEIEVGNADFYKEKYGNEKPSEILKKEIFKNLNTIIDSRAIEITPKTQRMIDGMDYNFQRVHLIDTYTFYDDPKYGHSGGTIYFWDTKEMKETESDPNQGHVDQINYDVFLKGTTDKSREKLKNDDLFQKDPYTGEYHLKKAFEKLNQIELQLREKEICEKPSVHDALDAKEENVVKNNNKTTKSDIIHFKPKNDGPDGR